MSILQHSDFSSKSTAAGGCVGLIMFAIFDLDADEELMYTCSIVLKLFIFV